VSLINNQELESRINSASDKEEALRLAIEAAQLCLDALKIATDTRQKSELRADATTLLERAESIRNGPAWPLEPPRSPTQCSTLSLLSSTPLPDEPPSPPPKPPAAKRLKEPVNERILTNNEQLLYYRNSTIHGFRFPPWKDAPDDSQFSPDPNGGPFNDLPLRLSKQQLESFDCWARAAVALPPPAMEISILAQPTLTMRSPFPVDLVQDVASDCSVVASLCALAAREERGHPTLLADIMLPFDREKEEPLISPNGKYWFRLNFNGCYRGVVVDDRLPVSKSDRMLHIIDRKCPSLLWPALLEKAYLKIRGGYDFPGSNSCTDLWILTGWIPEQIFLQDEDTNLHDVWENVQRGFEYGDVFVTMGTGKMSSKIEKALGLAGEHSYAVLDMKEEDGRRLVRLKNPWCDGPSWKPRHDKKESDQGDQHVNTDVVATSPSPQSNEEPGTFWMDLNNILQNFESIYLNWNPGLFKHRNDLHFTWNLPPTRNAGTNFIYNPQFAVTASANGSVWLLLCRHFTDSPKKDGNKAVATPQESAGKHAPSHPDMAGFICLYAFDRKGQKVRTSKDYIKRTFYVDSAQILLQLDMPAHTTYTVVPSEQGLPSETHTFSLIAFSAMPIELGHAKDTYSKSFEIESAWTLMNSGGSDRVYTYPTNPQFKLKVMRKARLALLLEPLNSDISVNVKLAYSNNGERLTKVTRRDIVMDSGDYCRGSANAEAEQIDEGTYSIICSTWEVGQESKFKLRVDSSWPCVIQQLPSEQAGKFLVDNLARPSFGPATSKMCAPLKVERHLRFTAIARFHSISGGRNDVPHSRSPIRLTFEQGHGPNRRILGVSSNGEFDDGAVVRCSDINLWPELNGLGDVWLVLDRLSAPVGGGNETYKVDLLVDGVRDKDWTIGVWREWD
jgi:calpain-7